MKQKNIYKVLGMLVTMALLFAAMPVGSAQAAMLEVCPTCAYATIQAAIDAAVDGDTINVAAGTYNEAITLTKAISLVGAGAETTVIDGNGLTSATLFSVSGITAGQLNISGFTFKDDPVPAALMTYLVSISGCEQPAEINFSNNTLVGTGDVDYDWGLLPQNNTASFVINNNKFDNIGGNSIMLERALGPVEIGDNVFIVPDSGGPAIWSMSYGTEVDPRTVDGLQWYHDNHISAKNTMIWSGITIAPAWGTGWNVRQYGSYTNVLIENNTVENFESVGIQIEVDGENSTANGEIRNNTLTAYPGQPFSKGIRLLGPVSNTKLTDNNITKGYRGIYLSGTWGQPIYPTNITTQKNKLADNTIGYEEIDALADQNALANWWGNNTGPAAGYVVGTDLYNPWCYTADCTELYVAAGGKIQDGIDLAPAGGVVHVGPGSYVENLLVNKSLEIAGESQASVTILPDLSAPNPCSTSSMCGGAASNVVLVAANNVKIHDLTIDGDNPALTSSVVRGGADLDARNGIIKNTDATYDNLEVYNTTVKNIYLRGIYSTNGSFDFHNNTVSNVQGEGASIAIFAWGGPGVIKDNAVSYANDAISANHSKGIQFVNNTVTYSLQGIHTDNSNDSGGVADLIEGNNIDCTGVSDGYGVFTFVPYVAPTVNNNTITKCAVGLSAWGEGAPVITQFTNNVVTGDMSAGSAGVFITTNILGYGYRDISVNFTGNNISGFETGVEFMADAASWDANPFVPKTINATFRSNKIHGNTYDIVQDTNGLAYNTDLSLNWWGSACGPDAVTGDVVYSPWYTDEAMTVTASGEPGSYTFSADATTESMNAVIACAPPDTTFTMDAASLPGGLVVHGNDLTFNLNGATVGAGSPAFEIFGDDVTINGPGTLLGDGASAGVLVHTGADNFILDGVEVTGWTDGVFVDGAVESLKIVNNWIHTNSESALEVDGTPTGVVTIEGNLFKVNDGVDVVYGGTGTLDATYNSWGAVTGPVDTLGANVAYDPWTFSEIFMDVDPGVAGDNFYRHVTDMSAFDVEIKAEAANLFGLSFRVKYDNTKLTLANTVFDPVWDGVSGDGFCTLTDLGAGVIDYRCTQLYPDAEWDGGVIATFTFNAIDSGDATFDVYADDTLSTAAAGGVKVWVNNAGFNDPSNPDRDITDEVDGLIDIDIAQYTGFIDLEGRPDDSGAVVTVYDDALGTTALASATSASSGAYTTAYLTGQSLNFEATQYIKVDRALFLPTYLLSKELTDSPLTFVQLLKLLGGDATNDDVIDIADATCIAAYYGLTPGACGSGGTSDVNGDGVVNIYDLTLMGGNYSKDQTPW